MKGTRRLAVGTVLALGIAGVVLALRSASAQDGLPDLTGTWTGSGKGKVSSLVPGVKAATAKSSLSATFGQSGSDIEVEVTTGVAPATGLVGSVGNGTFWAVSEDASAPFLVVGHVNKGATAFSLSALRGDAAGTIDAKFKAGR